LKLSKNKIHRGWLAGKIAEYIADQTCLDDLNRNVESLTSMLDLFSERIEPEQAERLYRIQAILTEDMNEFLRVNRNLKASTSQDEHALRALGSFALVNQFTDTLNLLLGDLIEIVRYLEKKQTRDLVEVVT